MARYQVTLRGLLVVLFVAFVGAALVRVLVPRSQFQSEPHGGCLHNQRRIVALLSLGDKYPSYSGPDLLLYLVVRGELDPKKDPFDILFCPGDMRESLALAGGLDAYRDLDIREGGHGHLTSYAGRDMREASCAVPRGDARAVVLVCDDSVDHHDGRGIVVGLSDGTVKWRSKTEDYGDSPVAVGEGSRIEELRCLRAE